MTTPREASEDDACCSGCHCWCGCGASDLEVVPSALLDAVLQAIGPALIFGVNDQSIYDYIAERRDALREYRSQPNE